MVGHQVVRKCCNFCKFHRMLIDLSGFTDKVLTDLMHTVVTSFLFGPVDFINKYILWLKLHLNQMELFISCERFIKYLIKFLWWFWSMNILNIRNDTLWRNPVFKNCSKTAFQRYLYHIANVWRHRNMALMCAIGGTEWWPSPRFLCYYSTSSYY
jgi:hypothetical protein